MKLRITIILKYHSWYLCQIWLLIMLLPIQEKIFKLATLNGPDIPWPKNWNYLTAKYFLLKKKITIFFKFWLGILDNLVCTGVTTGTLSLCIKIINSFRELNSLYFFLKHSLEINLPIWQCSHVVLQYLIFYLRKMPEKKHKRFTLSSM